MVCKKEIRINKKLLDMKLKSILAPALVACSFGTSAQAASVYGATEKDSMDCIQNLSLMGNYAKQAKKTGNYADAVAPWRAVYKNCPASHSSIYIYGPSILAWEMSQAKDAASKKKIFDELMGVYDNRIKYFADDKHPEFYIRGRKAYDYVRYSSQVGVNDPQNTKAYEWFGKSIEEGGAENELLVFQQYYMLSEEIYKKNPAQKRQQFVDDYLKVSQLLADRVEEGSDADSTFDQLKGAIDNDFGQSGACDGKILDGMYASQIDAKKNDKDFLKMVTQLYTMANSETSTVYFKASEYLYKLEPSYTSACGLAAQALQKKDINGAASYLDKAASLTTSNATKSNIMLKVASLYNKQHNSAKAREYARKAISYNSSNGMAYIIIGNLYASSASSIDADAFKQKYAYWAAVDKFEKAKAVDPTCASTANKLINTYKQYFPAKQDGFMRKIAAGSSVTVPGWIGETTTARFK